jgi:hypothetical protein
MTQTAELTPLRRGSIKMNGIVVWVIESESGHTYHTTVFEGRVTSCERTDGEPCPGWRYRHSCHHADLVIAREDERKSVAPSDKGALNGGCGGHAFSLLK